MRKVKTMRAKRAKRFSVAVLVSMSILLVLPSTKQVIADITYTFDIQDAGTIIDNNTTPFDFATVGNIGAITDVRIRFSALHSWDDELSAVLTSPQGTEVTLFANIGGSGANFQDTFFTDDGADISLASAPFDGEYSLGKGALLSAFDGENPSGTWTLSVTDNGIGDEGTLIAPGQTVDWGSGNTTAAGTELFIDVTPEPATVSVLVLGGMVLLLHRRRRRA